MCDRRRNAFKTTLELLCQLLWVVGLLVGLSGVYLLMKYRHSSLFIAQAYITMPALFALTSAAVLLATGCLCSRLSMRDSPCLQGLFVYLLVVVFCLESTALALAYFHSVKMGSDIAPLSEVFQKYTGSSQDANSRAVDATQEELQCCGVNDYRDWLETTWFHQTGGLEVPHSCCNTTFPSCNGTLDLPEQLYAEGCHLKLEKALQYVLNFIIWTSPLVFLLEVVLLLMVAQLMRKPSFVEYQVLEKHKHTVKDRRVMY